MVWTDSIKIIKMGMAYETTPGTAATVPQEYVYLNNDGILNVPRQYDEFRAHGSRALTFTQGKAYHVQGTIQSWAFPVSNCLGQWLSGVCGSDGTPVQHGTLPYVHPITVTDTQIPSWTAWMKTRVYEYKTTNNQVNKLVINQARNSVLQVTADMLGSQLASSTDFGSATYVTSGEQVFTSQKAYVGWKDETNYAMSDCNITIDNGINVDEAKIMGTAYANHILAGFRSISGTATMYVEDTTALTDYWGSQTGPVTNVTPIDLRFTWQSENIESGTTVPAAAYKSVNMGGTPTLAASGTFTGTSTDVAYFEVKCTTAGTPDKFKWRKNFGSWSAEVTVTGSSQLLSDGVSVTFSATTGGVVGDRFFVMTGGKPYMLDLHVPYARITSFDQKSVGNRLAATVNFTGLKHPTLGYDAKILLMNTKVATYLA